MWTMICRIIFPFCHSVGRLKGEGVVLEKCFRFEYMWMTNSSCQKVISRAWNSASGTNSIDELMAKVGSFARELSRRNHE